MEKTVEKEIEELTRTIESWEDADPLYVDKSTRDLRHRVMYVHARIEASLGVLLGRYVLEPLEGQIKQEVRPFVMTRFDKIISEMDFARKVDLAEKLGLIPGALKSRLFRVNNLRLIFSHPKSHEAEIKQFLDRKNHLGALQQIAQAFENMNTLFTRAS